MSSLTITDNQSAETGHTRYVVIYTDQAPAFTNVDGLIDHHDDESIATILIIAADGTTSPVTVEKEGGGVWTIRTDCHEEFVVEVVHYGADDEQVHREVYVPAFANESVPYFTEMSLRNA